MSRAREGPLALVARERRGQLAVELAVLLPIMVVVAIVAFNLMRYLEVCAAFDRLSYDAIVSQGVSPAGTATDASATAQVQEAIEGGLDGWDEVEVEVTAERVSGGTSEETFTLSPFLTRFTCTLTFRPWPSTFVIAGVRCEVPAALVHTRQLVVDRYRPGIVM